MLLHLGTATGLESRGGCNRELGVEAVRLERGSARSQRIPPGCLTCF